MDKYTMKSNYGLHELAPLSWSFTRVGDNPDALKRKPVLSVEGVPFVRLETRKSLAFLIADKWVVSIVSDGAFDSVGAAELVSMIDDCLPARQLSVQEARESRLFGCLKAVAEDFIATYAILSIM